MFFVIWEWLCTDTGKSPCVFYTLVRFNIFKVAPATFLFVSLFGNAKILFFLLISQLFVFYVGKKKPCINTTYTVCATP